MHSILPYCLHIIQANVPLALIGPAGTGKTTIARQIAEVLSEILDREMPFGTMSMTAGTSTIAFNGRVNPISDVFIPSQFSQIFENGGVFLFDELDAADDNTLLKANQPLANRRFANDSTGVTLYQHEHCYLMAALNTMGTGANRAYGARVKQDAAALDRWAMGRVKVDLDEKLERTISEAESAFAATFSLNGGAA
jgi:MoxR-like ATPase